MVQNGNLKLDLQDVYGKRLQEKVDILATQSSFEPAPTFRNQDARVRVSTDRFDLSRLSARLIFKSRQHLNEIGFSSPNRIKNSPSR